MRLNLTERVPHLLQKLKGLVSKEPERYKLVIRKCAGSEVIVVSDTEEQARSMAGQIQFSDIVAREKLEAKKAPPKPQPNSIVCIKRGYESKKLARLAHKKASFRIRPYLCDVCDKWHVANPDKVK